jgi:hypothetical protein
MRSVKLVPAMAVIVAAAFALAPAGASAARHPRIKHTAVKHLRHATRAGDCRLSIAAAPRNIEAGEPAEVSGLLECRAGTTVANQTVSIVQRSAGAASAVTATTTTNEKGEYKLPVAGLETNTVFSASAAGAESASKRVTVAPKVALTTPTTPVEGAQLLTDAGPSVGLGARHLARARNSNAVTFSGTVNAEEQGAEVVLQRENAIKGEEWRRIARGKVQAGGTFAIEHTFVVPGDANIRVVIKPFRFNGRGASDTRSYEISQAQNPLLTIQSSADPLSYEQTTDIAGTLGAGTAAAAAGTPVTLLARTRSQRKFTPVGAPVATGPGGSYAFPAQKPLQSTFYRVSAGGKLSAVLFEGVKYALTATASATSTPVGQPVKFSGTVTPWHAEHVVYLEAENASGLGFHVIQVAKVIPPLTPGGPATFALEHAFYNAGAGPRKVRIKVPGDPENQGTASETFEISLTPATMLLPEAPGNTTLPGPGQV